MRQGTLRRQGQKSKEDLRLRNGKGKGAKSEEGKEGYRLSLELDNLSSFTHPWLIRSKLTRFSVSYNLNINQNWGKWQAME